MAKAKSKAKYGLPTPLILLILLTINAAVVPLLLTRYHSLGTISWLQLTPYAFYLLSLPLSWLWFHFLKFKGDPIIPAIVLTLAGLGIVMQYRMADATAPDTWSFTWLAYPIGLFSFLGITALLNKNRLSAMAKGNINWLAYLTALAVIIAMALLGRRYRGGIYMPGNINPSEIIKPLLIIFLAGFLAKRNKAFSTAVAGLPTPRLGSLLLLLTVWVVPMIIILFLKDLGLLILLNAVLVTMLYVVSRRKGYLVIGSVAVVALAVAAMTLSPHARTRLEIWQNPFSDPTGKGWQLLQSLSAMYSGGMWGSGIGAGAPQTVPIAASDFVYAAWAEEVGFFGCALLLLLLATLFIRSWRASTTATLPFAMLLGTGTTAALAFQTILNIAGVTKALPLTGIPLPFISHGGSSLVATMIMAGLLTAISEK